MGDEVTRVSMPAPLNRRGSLRMPRSGHYPSSKKMQRPGGQEDKMRRPGEQEDKRDRRKGKKDKKEPERQQRTDLQESQFADRTAYRAAVLGKLTAAKLDEYEPEGSTFTLDEVQAIIEEAQG